MLKPRETIARLSPYRSPIVSRAGLSLDLNESMAGCSPRVLARLRSLSAAEVSLYPEREVGEGLIANFLGLAPEQVLLTNGMDEALALLFATYLGEGDELLFADPTFVMYPMLGEALGAHVVRLQSGGRPGASCGQFAVSDFAAHSRGSHRESQQSYRPHRPAYRLVEDYRSGA
jgi:histidinol-phosphate aminotransferase